MSDEFERPNVDVSLRGDTTAMPNRGTMTGVTDTYGADLGLKATNRMKSITAFTKSDAIDDNDGGDAEDTVI